MKRLVEIVSGRSDPILYATGHRPPGVMNNAQSRVTMTDFVGGDHSRRNQVINLIKLDLLTLKFFPNGVKPLYPALNPHERNFGFSHLRFNSFGNTAKKSFILCPALFKLFRQLTVILRMKMAKREIFKFATEFAHAKAVRDGSEDFHRLFGDAFSLFRIKVLKSTHVVQAVSQLHEDDSYVVNHRQQHLAYVFCLLFSPRYIADLRDLCEAVDEMGDFFPKICAYGIEVDEG